MLWCKQSDSAIFANSMGNNSDSSGPIKFIMDLIRDLMVTYVLTTFGADWLIFVDASVNKVKFCNVPKFKENNFGCSGTICSTIKLI